MIPSFTFTLIHSIPCEIDYRALDVIVMTESPCLRGGFNNDNDRCSSSFRGGRYGPSPTQTSLSRLEACLYMQMDGLSPNRAGSPFQETRLRRRILRVRRKAFHRKSERGSTKNWVVRTLALGDQLAVPLFNLRREEIQEQRVNSLLPSASKSRANNSNRSSPAI